MCPTFFVKIYIKEMKQKIYIKEWNRILGVAFLKSSLYMR